MPAKLELKPEQKILFIGDSITDADRNNPAYQPFGFGYVHFAANHLLAKYPQLDINIVNTGISGNTIRDLKARWEKDCLKHKPDILSVLIGINDLWRQYEGPDHTADAVYLHEYEDTYRQLLSEARQRFDCRMILMEPFMFCDDDKDPMFKELFAYRDIVGKLADEFDAVLVPLQKNIDEQIKIVHPEKWSADTVHPYLWAHAWIAEQWRQATGL